MSSFHLSSIELSKTHLHNPVELPRHFKTEHSESFVENASAVKNNIAPPQLTTVENHHSAPQQLSGSNGQTSLAKSSGLNIVLPVLSLLKLSPSDNNNPPKSSNVNAAAMSESKPSAGVDTLPALSLPPLEVSESDNDKNNTQPKSSNVDNNEPVQSNPSADNGSLPSLSPLNLLASNSNAPILSNNTSAAQSLLPSPIELNATSINNSKKSSELDDSLPTLNYTSQNNNILHAPPMLKLSENTLSVQPISEPSTPDISTSAIPKAPSNNVNIKKWPNNVHRLSIPTELPRYFQNQQPENSLEKSTKPTKYSQPPKSTSVKISKSMPNLPLKPGGPTVKTDSQLSSLKLLSAPPSLPSVISIAKVDSENSNNSQKQLPQPPSPQPVLSNHNSLPILNTYTTIHSSVKSHYSSEASTNNIKKSQQLEPSPSFKWPNGHVHKLSLPTELPRYSRKSIKDTSRHKSLSVTSPKSSMLNSPPRPGGPAIKTGSQLSSLKELPSLSVKSAPLVKTSSAQMTKKASIAQPKSSNQKLLPKIPSDKSNSAELNPVKINSISLRLPNLLTLDSYPPAKSIYVKENKHQAKSNKKTATVKSNTQPTIVGPIVDSKHDSSAIPIPDTVHPSGERRLSLPTELPRYSQKSIKNINNKHKSMSVTNQISSSLNAPERPGVPAVKTGSQLSSLKQLPSLSLLSKANDSKKERSNGSEKKPSTPSNLPLVLSKKDSSAKSKPSIISTVVNLIPKLLSLPKSKSESAKLVSIKSLPILLPLQSVSAKEKSIKSALQTSTKMTKKTSTVHPKSSIQNLPRPVPSIKSNSAKLEPVKIKPISLRLPNLLTLDSYPPAKSIYVTDNKSREKSIKKTSTADIPTNIQPAFVEPAVPIAEHMHTPTVLSYFPQSPQLRSPIVPNDIKNSQPSMASSSNLKAISDMSKLMWSNETSFQLPSLLSFLNSDSGVGVAANKERPSVGGPEPSFKAISSIPSIKSIPSQSDCVQCPPTAAGFAPFCAMPKTASFSQNSVLKFPNKCLFNLYNCKNPDKRELILSLFNYFYII